MNTTAPLCADCQHLRVNPQNKRHGPICASSAFAADLVTGDPIHNCELERTRDAGLCGAAGTLFEQRNPHTYVTWVSRPGPLLDAGVTC